MIVGKLIHYCEATYPRGIDSTISIVECKKLKIYRLRLIELLFRELFQSFNS